ncbi:MAG: IS3 family transposase [Candidatus Paceibacterota bacterium]
MGKDIKLLCGIAGASKSGYYWRLEHSDEKDKDHDDYLLVKEIFEDGKSKYGWRQVQMHLDRKKKITMNHKKIVRIMKKYNLVARVRRRDPYKAIMKKTAEHRTFENKLDRNFNQMIPHKFFCTDITYLFYNNRVAYLSAIKDIATGEIMAWHASPHITIELVLGTINQMKKYKNALIHSDQGFHYTNPEYIKEVELSDMVQSMSRKGNCIDNAPIESFFGHLKDDVDYKDCKTFEELYLLIENYIRYYNHERAQWDLKKNDPGRIPRSFAGVKRLGPLFYSCPLNGVQISLASFFDLQS